jgi:hypothetical protein
VARFAIGLGALNVLAFVAAGAFAMRWLESEQEATSAATARASQEWAPQPPPTPRLLVPHFSEDRQVLSVSVGDLVLVDVGTEVPTLSGELERQRKLARQRGGRVLLWVVQPQCGPCNGVAASLKDPLMQQALDSVRLVRVDASRFGSELGQLGIPYDVIPGFALLDDQNRPLDYINGGEWDEDIAPNIAPVLSEFVRGSYKARRRPFSGVKREDETAL